MIPEGIVRGKARDARGRATPVFPEVCAGCPLEGRVLGFGRASGRTMPELGKKFECYNCRTKFYNLGRPEAICPKCGANQKNAKSEDAPVSAPRPPRRSTVIMEPPPEGNPDEFGEEPAAAEEEERGEDDEFAEDEEIVEADREQEEEF